MYGILYIEKQRGAPQKEKKMKKYFVLLEDVKRKTDEIGYCDPIIKKEFDDEAKARTYYEKLNVENEFDYLCNADKEDHYLEKSLVAVEYVYDDDEDAYVDAGEMPDYLETQSAGKNWSDDER